MKSRIFFVICLLSFVIFLLSCKRTTEPKFPVSDLQLTVQDVSCTEAWLSLKAGDSLLGDTLKLYGNDSLILSHELNAADSLLYADSLQPATEYAFEARVYDGGALLAASQKATAATMDTTSHDFTWQTFEFGGQGGSSAFYDVAVIDQNDAWAVGEIYTADETYNAAHWNGEKWELKRIKTAACGGVVYPPLETVFSFGKNDIVFSDGAMFIHFDGDTFKSDCSLIPNLTGGVRKIWGTSNKDYYVVGTNGLIAHYDGREWQRIESGMDENIQDIWGVYNKETGQPYILCAASQVLVQSEKLILNILPNNTVHKDNWPFNDRKPYSVWFKNRKRIFACGDGIFTRELKGNWELLYDEIPYFMNRIRGSDINNLYVVGAFGLISHFNGISWKTLPTKLYGSYVAVDIKGNLVVTVGYENRPALLTMIQRSN